MFRGNMRLAVNSQGKIEVVDGVDFEPKVSTRAPTATCIGMMRSCMRTYFDCDHHSPLIGVCVLQVDTNMSHVEYELVPVPLAAPAPALRKEQAEPQEAVHQIETGNEGNPDEEEEAPST
jgi:hypothetical protein